MSPRPRVERHKTAIGRAGFSRPVRLALEAGLIDTQTSVLDYGCGRGGDMEALRRQKIRCSGWDPVHRPRGRLAESDIVNLGYVVNVIEDPAERRDALRQAWALTLKVLVISARLEMDGRELVNPSDFGDGTLTRLNTFQKFYSQSELREWIDTVLNSSSVAAAPGVFLVFKDDTQRQQYVAASYRRRRSAPRVRKSDLIYEQHRELLDELASFVANRGRVPEPWEYTRYSELRDVFGTAKRAFQVVRNVTGAQQWEAIREESKKEHLLYLALEHFGHRPAFGKLALDIQKDVRDFFGTYKRACTEADSMLFRLGDREELEQTMVASPIGKLTGNALYLHLDALPQVDPLLKLYEGCARAYVGGVEGANIVKLHRTKPKVSYLAYPDFDRKAHPTLLASLSVSLDSFKLKMRRYGKSANPPILHRKECFLASDDPRRTRFEKLTRQEERLGLYDDPSIIGTVNGWAETLERCGVVIRGHRARQH